MVDEDTLEPGGVTEQLSEAVKSEFTGLLDFYGKALAAGKHVIFSVA